MQDTLPRIVMQQARRLAGRPALQSKIDGQYQPILWDEVTQQIDAFSRSLLGLGLQSGDRCAIMSPNCPEWVYADLGGMSIGGISVPVYHTEGLPSVLHILDDSGSRFLFLHSPVVGEDMIPRLPELKNLERIILLEGKVDHPLFLSMDEFFAAGEPIPQEQVDALRGAGDDEAVATLVYTSGTTGRPKGAMLSHRNILSNIAAARQLFDIGPNDVCLSFLPLSHIFERMAGYYFMLHQGAVIAYAENFDSVPANLLEVRPTILISVPRLYEKLYARVMERGLSSPWLKKQIFFGAVKIGRAWVKASLERGEEVGGGLRLGIKLARHLVFDKLRQPLGGRLRFFVSGGAPLAREIAEFFLAAGLPIYEGYGLTETSPVLAANRPGAHRPGTVGQAIPGTELRIAEDGEILARGPGVFSGYWESPELTTQVFDEGWFCTGDIGVIDENGFLTITDRKKDLIVTAGGENIAPQYLENLFKTDKYLANAFVYGDQKPYLTALLVPNFDSLEKFARSEQIAFLNHCDLVNHPRVLELVRSRVDTLQQGFQPIMRIKRFTLLSRDFCGDEVTPTLKVRRKVVRERFHQVLDGMYQPQGHGIHDSGFCVVEPGAAG